MRAIICGGRDFIVEKWAFKRLDIVHTKMGITHVIEGGAFGADRLGRYWAAARGIPFTTVRAAWDQHGKSAGYKRNVQMADEHAPDIVIAMPGGVGTQMMVDIAKKRGLPVIYLTKVKGFHK